MQADGSVEFDLGPVSEGDNDGSMGDLGDGLLDEVDSEDMEDEEARSGLDEANPQVEENELEEMDSVRGDDSEDEENLPELLSDEDGPLPPHIIEMPGLISDEDEMDSVRGDDSEDEENLPAFDEEGPLPPT